MAAHLVKTQKPRGPAVLRMPSGYCSRSLSYMAMLSPAERWVPLEGSKSVTGISVPGTCSCSIVAIIDLHDPVSHDLLTSVPEATAPGTSTHTSGCGRLTAVSNGGAL